MLQHLTHWAFKWGNNKGLTKCAVTLETKSSHLPFNRIGSIGSPPFFSGPFRCYRLSLISSLSRWSEFSGWWWRHIPRALSWVGSQLMKPSTQLVWPRSLHRSDSQGHWAAPHSIPDPFVLATHILTCHSQPRHPPCRKSRWVGTGPSVLHKPVSSQVTGSWFQTRRIDWAQKSHWRILESGGIGKCDRTIKWHRSSYSFENFANAAPPKTRTHKTKFCKASFHLKSAVSWQWIQWTSFI